MGERCGEGKDEGWDGVESQRLKGGPVRVKVRVRWVEGQGVRGGVRVRRLTWVEGQGIRSGVRVRGRGWEMGYKICC